MQAKVVVMGGGTGTFPVISGLKRHGVDLTSVIAVSDSGGSTGRIRDEFGFQPVGDLRQALAALAEDKGQEWIRRILLYRFKKGNGLRGHNLGNLLLTALQDMTGDTTQALEISEKIFRLEGKVVPVTQDNVSLEIHYLDGTTAVGEHILDLETPNHKKIHHITLSPSATINPLAAQEMMAADMIVIGPGDYYASLMATLLPKGMKKVFKKTKAKVVYVLNLMTRFSQTHEMTASQHVRGIEKAIGRSVDRVIINTGKISPEVIEKYAQEKAYPVENDLQGDKRVLTKNILSPELVITAEQDEVHRSLLRHDSQKIATVLLRILKKKK